MITGAAAQFTKSGSAVQPIDVTDSEVQSMEELGSVVQLSTKGSAARSTDKADLTAAQRKGKASQSADKKGMTPTQSTDREGKAAKSAAKKGKTPTQSTDRKIKAAQSAEEKDLAVHSTDPAVLSNEKNDAAVLKSSDKKSSPTQSTDRRGRGKETKYARRILYAKKSSEAAVQSTDRKYRDSAVQTTDRIDQTESEPNQ